MMNESILFIFGPARGGTTYLGSILDNWFDVGTGPEGTFIKSAKNFASQLGDLSIQENKTTYAKYLSQVEMLEIIRKRYPEDVSFDVTPEDILDRMPGNSAADGIFAVFKAVADYRKKTRVGNKNPGYWKYLPLLGELFPENSYFIFILRDGRDVALSLKNVPWGGQSVYEAALEWRRMLDSVEEFRETCPDDRFLIIRYEDLLTDPAQEIRRIGKFLQAHDLSRIVREIEEDMAENAKRNNFNKWKTDLPEKEIEFFEALAGDKLKKYNYETIYTNPRISMVVKLSFLSQSFFRLVKLNIYNFNRKLPQDKKKWKASKLKAIFRPGLYKK